MAQSVAQIIPMYGGHANSFCSLTCLIWISFACSEQPSIKISPDTDKTLREGDTFNISCSILNPVHDGVFKWTHLSNVYNVTTAEAFPQVTITEPDGNVGFRVSSLSISSLTIDDSGNITCLYLYPITGSYDGMRAFLKHDVNVCVSQQPVSPSCFIEGESISILCISPTGICPDDITMQWFDMSSMQAQNGTTTRSDRMVEQALNIDRSIDAFICVMESNLFPKMHLNCSISISSSERTTATATNVTNGRQTDLPNVTSSISLPSSTTTSSLALTATISAPAISMKASDNNAFPSTTSTINSAKSNHSGGGTATTSTTTYMTFDPIASTSVFSHTIVIAAALAGAGGVLIILFAAIGIYFACKRCTKNTPGGNLDIDFELATRKVFPEIEEGTQANINAMRLSKDEKENEQTERNDVPLPANPNKDIQILNGLSNSGFTHKDDLESTNLYASVHESADEDNDRQKLDSPVKEDLTDHAYAYPDIVKDASLTNENSSSSFDSLPTESGVDSPDENEISSDPHYFTLEKAIEAEDVLKRRESMPIYAKPDKSQNKRRESMPTYAKPDKIKK